MTESRDLQIEKNQEKSIQLKALRGTIDDVTLSRDGWKEKKVKLEKEFTQTENKLNEKEKEIERKNRQILELNGIIEKTKDLLSRKKKKKKTIKNSFVSRLKI